MEKMTVSSNYTIVLWATFTAISFAVGYQLGTSNASSTKKSSATLLRSKEMKEGKLHNDTDEEESESEDESDEDEDIESTSLNDIPGEVRMALVIRQDLGMTKGKIAAQCCHAALSCFRHIATNPARASYNPIMTQRWLNAGQAKITLKCPDKFTMDELYAKAISLGVNAAVIHDAGRTQIAAGSATVLGLGPAPKAVLDQITGDLKLY
ncbi:BGP_1a_G0001320.mRNA.1.CDS.1 [Saccharomyces cerevisiae]|nr:BGP_1a_G0001320.mRNA.1.CDS.1 [Saccharomyces cerevisiae]CAI7037734.1 BGP_1a_G0001320.mRNA.1.CDS.1 [Saccharomyces cerevisiae]